MFDWLRDLIKTDEVKRQEAITAYLDGLLTPKQRQRFEKQLAGDSNLQREVQSQLFVKENLGRLPRLDAPRNFTLDPAKYGVPERQTAPIFYPALRAATALAAIVFVLALVLDLFIIDSTRGPLQSALSEEPAVAFTTTLVEDEAVEEAQEQEIELAPREPEQGEAEATVVAEEMIVAEEVVVEAEAPAEEEVAEETSTVTPMAEVVAEGESGDAAPTAPPEEPSEEAAGAAAAQELGSDEIESEAPEPSPTPTIAQPVPRKATESASASATPTEEPDLGSQVESESTARSASTPAIAAQAAEQPETEPRPVDDDSGVRPAETDEDRTETPIDAISPIRLAEVLLGAGVVLLATLTLFVRRRL